MRKRGFKLAGRGVFLYAILVVLLIALIGAATIQYQILSSSNPAGLDGNITYEPSNFTHLNISDQAPYDLLHLYYMSDSYRSGIKIFDMSNNNFDANLTNGANIASNCIYDNCINFDGANDYVSLPQSSTLAGKTQVTVMGWGNLTRLQLGTGFAALYGEVTSSSATARVTLLINSSGNFQMRWRDSAADPAGTAAVLGNSTVITLGQWYHYAFVYDSVGDFYRIYINGQLAGTSTTAYAGLGTSTSAGISLGQNGDNVATNWTGQIDEVMVFNTNLSAQQVLDIYNNQSVRFKAQGVQTYLQQNISLASGDDKVNVTLDFEKNFGSNVQTRLGMWFYNSSTASARNYLNENVSAYANFDGVDDVITTPITTQFTDFTACVWFKEIGVTGSSYERIIDKKFDTGFWLGRNATNANQWGGGILESADPYGNYTTLTDGVWHNLCMARSGTVKTLYGDGALKSTSTVSGTAVSTTNLIIGKSNNGAAIFNGSIDEVMIWNRALSASEILSINSSNRNPFSGNNTGLVSYYSFNTGSTQDDFGTNPGTAVNGTNVSVVGESGLVGYWHGDGNANDYSGLGNDGTLTNGATATGAGVYNQSFVFDGVNDIITASSLSSQNSLSVSVWIKTLGNSTNVLGYVITTGNATLHGWGIGINKNYGSICGGANTRQLFFGNYSDATTVCGSTLNLNQWYHVVAVNNGTFTSLYLNGVLNASIGQVLKYNSPPLQIGSRHDTTSLGFNGSIDEVMIFNRSLTALEIQSLYVKGRANWTYNSFTNVNATNMSLLTTTTNILPEVKLIPGNTTSLFYTPLILGVGPNLTVTTFASNFSFVNPTDTTGSNLSRANIIANVTYTPAGGFDTIIVYLANTTNIINISNSSSSPFYVNFTNVPNGVIYLNASVNDSLNQLKWTEMRTFTVDTGLPNGTLMFPANNTYNATTTQNFTVNVSDNLGVKNVTLNIINASATGNNQWLTFDGVNDYVNLSSVPNPLNWAGISISAWIKIVRDQTYGTVVMRATGAGNQVYFTVGQNGVNTDQPCMILGQAGWLCSGSGNALSLNTWYHVVVEANSSSRVIYINGTNVASNADAYSMASASTNWYIGDQPEVAWDSPLNGSVDELRIYNRTLSASEVSSIYNSGMNRNSSLPSDNLTAWYDFEQTETTLTDQSGNSYSGVLYNGPVWQGGSIINQTTTNVIAGTTNAVIGTVVTLIDGIYNWFYDIFDWAGNRFITGNRTLTIDTVNPIIAYGNGAEGNVTNISRTNIVVNVTATDTNLKNITINLYNITGDVVNTSSTVTSPNYINFTNLRDSNYTFNATSYDLANNSNKTETRIVIIDTINPIINFTIGTETNNSFVSKNNVVVNVTATDTNLKNITVYVYNSSWTNATVWTSSPAFVNVTGLADGNYSLNSTAYDYAGNINTTSYRTITLDTTAPNGTLMFPANNTFNATTTQNFTVNVSDNLGVKNATLNIVNDTSDIVNQTTTNVIAGTTNAVIGTVVTLVDGVYKWFYDIFDWAGNRFITGNRTLTIDIVAPSVTNITYLPMINDSVDPNTNISFNVSVLDLKSGVN